MDKFYYGVEINAEKTFSTFREMISHIKSWETVMKLKGKSVSRVEYNHNYLDRFTFYGVWVVPRKRKNKTP